MSRPRCIPRLPRQHRYSQSAQCFIVEITQTGTDVMDSLAVGDGEYAKSGSVGGSNVDVSQISTSPRADLTVLVRLLIAATPSLKLVDTATASVTISTTFRITAVQTGGTHPNQRKAGSRATWRGNVPRRGTVYLPRLNTLIS